jgi:hypothetical protein
LDAIRAIHLKQEDGHPPYSSPRHDSSMVQAEMAIPLITPRIKQANDAT